MVCQCLSCPGEPKTGGSIPDPTTEFLNRGEGSLPLDLLGTLFPDYAVGLLCCKSTLLCPRAFNEEPQTFPAKLLSSQSSPFVQLLELFYPRWRIIFCICCCWTSHFLMARFSSLHSNCDSQNMRTWRYLTIAVVSTMAISLYPTNAAACTTQREGQALKL